MATESPKRKPNVQRQLLVVARNHRLGIAFALFCLLYLFYSLLSWLWNSQPTAVASGVLSVSGHMASQEHADHHHERDDAAHDDDPCWNHDGILLISSAAVSHQSDNAGSSFILSMFSSVLNQLHYAERYNLLPWIHLKATTNVQLIDDKVHNASWMGLRSTEFSMELIVLTGVEQDIFHDDINGQDYEFPAAPILDHTHEQSTYQQVRIEGTGIWNTYFDEPTRFHPLLHLAEGDHNVKMKTNSQEQPNSCASKPIFQLTEQQLEPGLLDQGPNTIRAWRDLSLSPSLAQWPTPLVTWLAPMRQSAHDLVARYYHPTIEMETLAERANPIVEVEESCLAISLRQYEDTPHYHHNRPTAADVLPFVHAYMNAAVWVAGTSIVIYIATDSDPIWEDIQTTWPRDALSYVRSQPDVHRFGEKHHKNKGHHHRTSTEALVDVLAMAKCEFIVHAANTMSEAVHYFNPQLHYHSVHLQDETKSDDGLSLVTRLGPSMPAEAFEKLVRKRLQDKRKHLDASKQKMVPPPVDVDGGGDVEVATGGNVGGLGDNGGVGAGGGDGGHY